MSKNLISNSADEPLKAVLFLESEELRKFEVRFIEELFVFTKCDKPETVVCKLRYKLNLSLVDVFNNGIKVYVVPKNLDKGTAVKRFRAYLGDDVEKVVAAGDSEFDISMVECADEGIVPKDFRSRFELTNDEGKICEMLGKKVFAEEMLEKIWLER